jgi:DNA (cytosine-5)-methyltransferase 1
MSNEIKFFSMFTGVGGFELGIQGSWSSRQQSRGSEQGLLSRGDKSTNKEFECVGFSEIDKYASKLLANKFPSVRNYGDATRINADELPDFDFLCGGFPCQAFSIAGKRRGFEESRGTLFFEIARIVNSLRFTNDIYVCNVIDSKLEKKISYMLHIKVYCAFCFF